LLGQEDPGTELDDHSNGEAKKAKSGLLGRLRRGFRKLFCCCVPLSAVP